MRYATGPGDLMIIVPALNEEGSIGQVVKEIQVIAPGVPIMVLDDCSADSTAVVAVSQGADVISMPTHLGLGGVVQAGYKLAFELGYDYVIRLDGDGQHDPAYIPAIFQTLRQSGCQMVIGSRFLEPGQPYTSLIRSFGIRFFRAILRPILGRPVSDPTSGYVGVNREALALFARSFPLEYPEIEALVVLQRRAFRFEEISCVMRPRRSGKSTITPVRSLYYIIHVLLGVFVNILKFERHRWRR